MTYSTAEMAVGEEMLYELATVLAGVMGVFFAITFIAILAIVVLLVISNWKIFKKAGQPGWKALIPVYSDYIFYKIAWKPRWFWIAMIISVIIAATSEFIGATPETAMIVSILSTICAIFACVIEIIMHVKLAKAFRKDGGFAVGLILLPFIFFPILAFGSAKYRKKKKRRPQPEVPQLPEAYQ